MQCKSCLTLTELFQQWYVKPNPFIHIHIHIHIQTWIHIKHNWVLFALNHIHLICNCMVESSIRISNNMNVYQNTLFKFSHPVINLGSLIAHPGFSHAVLHLVILTVCISIKERKDNLYCYHSPQNNGKMKYTRSVNLNCNRWGIGVQQRSCSIGEFLPDLY